MLQEVEGQAAEGQAAEGQAAVMGSVALSCCMCGGGLAAEPGRLRCLTVDCPGIYPVVNGIPVLINEKNSIFSIDGFVRGAATFFPHHRPDWIHRMGTLLP